MKLRRLTGCCLLAAAGTAAAADVQVYGVVDTSIVFESVDQDKGAGRVNQTYMSSGEEWGSRWGIRGSEQLGNGLTVGFDLQSGIKSDSGELQYNRLFARESSIHVKGGFGKLAFGRMDGLIGLRGQTGRLKMLSAFGDGYGPYMPSLNNIMSEPSYVDNSVFYESPALNGFTFRAHYGMGGVSFNQAAHGQVSAKENSASSDRYAAATLTYASGPLGLFVGVDRIFYNAETVWGTATKADGSTYRYRHSDDSLTVTLGGNYDFGACRIYAMAQYFDEVDSGSIRKFLDTPYALKGFGTSVSADIPAAGGNVIVALSYLNGKNADSDTLNADTDVERLIAGAGYQYPFTKRTSVYGIVSAGRDRIEKASGTQRPDYCKAVAGLRHVF